MSLLVLPQMSQVHYKSLTDMLTLVCGSYFNGSMSSYLVDRALGLQLQLYHRYIVCPNTSCRQLYDWCRSCGRTWRYVASPPACCCGEEAKRGAEPDLTSEDSDEARRDRLGHVCLHVRYPRHPRADGSLPCGTRLFKAPSRGHAAAPSDADRTADDDGNEEKNGATAARVKKTKAVRVPEPCLVYCYRLLPQRLSQLLCRPGVEDQLEEWRSRLSTTPAGLMTDVYHGRMWAKFQEVLDRNTGVRHPFLSRPYKMALTINVDWLQVFEHVVYSVGVIYLTVNNLPREERFKKHNVIIVSTLPRGTEKDLDLDTYLQPLIDDLLRLSPTGPGVRMQTHLHPKDGVPVRAAVFAVVCDRPASAKVSGFAGATANKGCTRCEVDWGTSGESKLENKSDGKESKAAPPDDRRAEQEVPATARASKLPQRLSFAQRLAAAEAEAAKKECERRYGAAAAAAVRQLQDEVDEKTRVGRATRDVRTARATRAARTVRAGQADEKKESKSRTGDRAPRAAKKAAAPDPDDADDDDAATEAAAGQEDAKNVRWHQTHLRQRRRRHPSDYVAACAWREASTASQAKALLSHTGVRWFALL